MPKDKKRAPSTSDSDSGPEDRAPVKKSKPAPKAASSSTSLADSKEPSWHLGRDKHVKVCRF